METALVVSAEDLRSARHQLKAVSGRAFHDRLTQIVSQKTAASNFVVNALPLALGGGLLGAGLGLGAEAISGRNRKKKRWASSGVTGALGGALTGAALGITPLGSPVKEFAYRALTGPGVDVGDTQALVGIIPGEEVAGIVQQETGKIRSYLDAVGAAAGIGAKGLYYGAPAVVPGYLAGKVIAPALSMAVDQSGGTTEDILIKMFKKSPGLRLALHGQLNVPLSATPEEFAEAYQRLVRSSGMSIQEQDVLRRSLQRGTRSAVFRVPGNPYAVGLFGDPLEPFFKPLHRFERTKFLDAYRAFKGADPADLVKGVTKDMSDSQKVRKILDNINSSAVRSNVSDVGLLLERPLSTGLRGRIARILLQQAAGQSVRSPQFVNRAARAALPAYLAGLYRTNPLVNAVDMTGGLASRAFRNQLQKAVMPKGTMSGFLRHMPLGLAGFGALAGTGLGISKEIYDALESEW